MGKKKGGGKQTAEGQERIKALVARLVEHGHVNLARAWAKKLEPSR
jgi:hypothetical protein